MNKVLLIILLTLPLSSLAGGMTVHDPVNWIQHKITAVEQKLTKLQMEAANHKLAVMTKQQLDLIEEAKLRHSQLQSTINSVSGKNNYGRLFWGPFQMLDKNKTPETWDELYLMTRNIGRGDNQQPTDYENAVADYLQRNPYNEVPARHNAPSLEQKKVAAIGMGVNAEQAYQAMSRHYQNINRLQVEMNKTNTLKESLDLTNRILAEISLVQMHHARLYAIDAQMNAQKEQRDYNRQSSSIPYSTDIDL